MVKGDFRGFERAKAIRSSGDHFELVIHAFNATCRNLTSRDKPIEQEAAMAAKRPRDFFDRLDL